MMAASAFSVSAALQPVANHVWQSTLFLALVALLTLVLRRNRAQLRYWFWLAGSVKFLIPVAPLIAMGRQVGWRATATVQPEMSFWMDAMTQPFSRPAVQIVAAASPGSAAHSAGVGALIVLAGIWVLGCTAVLLTWWVGWRQVAAAVRHGWVIEDGREVDTLRRLEKIGGLKRPLALMASNSSFEPGVFGVAKPVLLWPRDIGARFDDRQLEAILAHEVCHVRRRDNLAVAVHMFVEAVFWFYPPVWWVEARLVDERERACDEDVIRLGTEPQVYAESILKMCEFYLESPLVCVAGVTGSDLKKRIEAIMRSQNGEALTRWKKLLLVTAGALTAAMPVVGGILNAPPVRAQAPTAAVDPLAFEVASVKQNKSGSRQVNLNLQPGGRFTATNVSLEGLVRVAYGLPSNRLSLGRTWIGGGDYLTSDHFDIVAKAEGNPSRDQLPPMLRALLVDRFKLIVHHETKELPIYALVMARKDGRMGPRLRRSDVDCSVVQDERSPQAPASRADVVEFAARPCTLRNVPGKAAGRVVTIETLARLMSSWLDDHRPVEDRTGLTGNFDLDLDWTPDRALPPDAPPMPPINPNSPSLFTALQEQLGLKLEPGKSGVDVLVVDRAERPTRD
jgi:bla regulator protein BlaR1